MNGRWCTVADLSAESLQHPDRDTRDLRHKPMSELEESVDLIQYILSACGMTEQLRLRALLALQIVAAPARALEALDAEFSLFTTKDPDGTVELAVQDALCERKFTACGATLTEAIKQAASAAVTERRARELEAK